MARDGGAERGTEVKAEMMRALDSLEGLVREGRASIARERSRQEEVRYIELCIWEEVLSFHEMTQLSKDRYTSLVSVLEGETGYVRAVGGWVRLMIPYDTPKQLLLSASVPFSVDGFFTCDT